MKSFSWREWRQWAMQLFPRHGSTLRRHGHPASIENLESRTLLSGTSLTPADEGAPADEEPAAEVPDEEAVVSEEESSEPKEYSEEYETLDFDITYVQRNNSESSDPESSESFETEPTDPALEDSGDDAEVDDTETDDSGEEVPEDEFYDVMIYTMGAPEENSDNHAPAVVDDSGITDEDVGLQGSVSPLGVDEDGDPLTYSIVVEPEHGTVSLSPDGTFVYTPDPDFNGSDSFTFEASDGNLTSSQATFSVQTSPVNDPFELTLASAPTEVLPNYVQVAVDTSALVGDVDTQLSYSGTVITAKILSGGSSRDVLSIRHQGTGAGLVKVKKQALYFDGSTRSVARFSGGYGKPLVITFNSNATEAAVNAILKQIGFKTSKKGGAGLRTIQFQVKLGNQTAVGTAGVNVVPIENPQ